jgi:hypothetical protein
MPREPARSDLPSRASVWGARVLLLLVILFPGSIILYVLTASVLYQGRFMIREFDKYQEYSNVIHVSNIDGGILPNGTTPLICNGLSPIIPLEY